MKLGKVLYVNKMIHGKKVNFFEKSGFKKMPSS